MKVLLCLKKNKMTEKVNEKFFMSLVEEKGKGWKER